MGQEEALSRKPEGREEEMDTVRLWGLMDLQHMPALMGTHTTEIPNHPPAMLESGGTLARDSECKECVLLKRNIWKQLSDCNIHLS